MGWIVNLGSGAFVGAAALSLSIGAVAHAQQAKPAAATAQPQVGLGLAIEEDPQGPRVGALAPAGTAEAIGVRPGGIILQFCRYLPELRSCAHTPGCL